MHAHMLLCPRYHAETCNREGDVECQNRLRIQQVSVCQQIDSEVCYIDTVRKERLQTTSHQTLLVASVCNCLLCFTQIAMQVCSRCRAHQLQERTHPLPPGSRS